MDFMIRSLIILSTAHAMAGAEGIVLAALTGFMDHVSAMAVSGAMDMTHSSMITTSVR